MSDETKGATVIPGCRHDNDVSHDGLGTTVCNECAAKLDTYTWRKLHSPPEPPKPWVRRKAEEGCSKGATFGEVMLVERLMRETVEECCRVLVAKYHHNLCDDLRRAMLEPKA